MPDKKWPLGPLRIELPDLQLAARATIAATVAYLLADWFDLPKGYWAVLTAILVVQSSLGASVAAALDRCLGTISGGALGVLFAILAGPSFPLTVLLLAVGTFLTALLVARNPGFKLAPVTLGIVMLADPTHADPWMSGLERVFEIGIGGAVGLACALFVLPAKALGYLFPHVADALDGCARLVETGVAGLLEGGLDPAVVDGINADVRSALRAADVRAGEARRERVGRLGPQSDLGPIVRGGRRLWHSVIMLMRGADHALPPGLAAEVGPSLSAAARAITTLARDIATSLRATGTPSTSVDAAAAVAAVAALDAEMDRLTRDGAFTGEGASLVRLAAAVAAFEHMKENLSDLATRLAEIRAARDV